jgi:pyruvate/2-oxoglutarate dehydrogenase complex dihydrolipoamide dehydrogenase (E3) component
LVAVGRQVDLGALGVESIGVDTSARAISVDENMRVTEGVWALGDVTGKGAFTHVSMYQSAIVIDEILGRPHAPARYHALPRVTFTDPEVASVGMTEAQARETFGSVDVAMSGVGQSTRGWIHKADDMVKLIAHDGVLVGATAVGPSAGEVLGFLALAVQERTPVANLKSMIYAYPTFYRAIEAALAKL